MPIQFRREGELKAKLKYTCTLLALENDNTRRDRNPKPIRKFTSSGCACLVARTDHQWQASWAARRC